jgi:multidrug efflux pump subunit AcrA (membrane-fusion protein)
MSDILVSAPDFLANIRRYRFIGLAAIVVFLGTFGVWATMAPLTGAIIAPGHFAVEGSIKQVQHQTGGVVAEIAVEDGQHVATGDILIRLDATAVRSNLAILTDQLEADLLTQAREMAERVGLDHFAQPSAAVGGQPAELRATRYSAELAYLASEIAQTTDKKASSTNGLFSFEARSPG